MVSTSFSKEIEPLPAFSTFNKTLAPTLGENTFMRKTLLTEKSIGPPRPIQLPPQGSPAFFTILATLAEVLIPLDCGLATTVTLPPLKSFQA